MTIVAIMENSEALHNELSRNGFKPLMWTVNTDENSSTKVSLETKEYWTCGIGNKAVYEYRGIKVVDSVNEILGMI